MFRFYHRVANDRKALREQVVRALSVNILKDELEIHWKTNCKD